MSKQNILDQSLKEYDVALKYRATRVKASWHPNEDLYYNKKQKKLQGRHNIQLGEMQGFLDTLSSKIDDPVVIKFIETTEADKRKAAKVTKAWELDSGETKGDWSFKDLLGKKQAGIYGRAAYKYFATHADGYKSNLVGIDVYDLLVDPLAGGLSLEEARFLGHDNIFKSIEDLEADPDNYDKAQVAKLKENLAKDTTVQVDNEQNEKDNREKALSFSAHEKYASGQLARLCEWYTTFKGIRYLCTFEHSTKTWVRVDKLKEVFTTAEYPNGDPLWPIDDWATNPDYFEHWTPSPADQVRDIIIAKSILINQALDNRQYKNFGMKAYDIDMFKNPAMLEPRFNGLVGVKVPENKNIQNGIYEFQYPSLGDTDQLYQILDEMKSRNSGVTPGMQGETEKDKKVGIYAGELKEAQDRLGLLNKSYARFWARMAKRYINGLKEHMTEEMAVKMIGEHGIEWDKLVKEDLSVDFDIAIATTNSGLMAISQVNQGKMEVLKSDRMNANINQKTLEEKIHLLAGFEPAEIKDLLDTQNDGNMEILSEAAEENEKMLEADEKPNEGATTRHIKKHLEFVADNQDLDPTIKGRILAHANLEVEFARKNMAQMIIDAQLPMPPAPIPTMPGKPTPGAPMPPMPKV